MPQLDPTWFASQLFWLLLTFGALYFVLARKVLPVLQGVLDKRAQTMSSDIDTAQRAKSQAEEAKQNYERALAEARANAQKLMSETMAAQKAKAEQTARELDQQAIRNMAEAEQKITARKQELINSLSPAAGELAGMIVEKLTRHAPAAGKVQAVLGELSKVRNG